MTTQQRLSAEGIQVTVFGETGVGHTALVQRFVTDSFQAATDPTRSERSSRLVELGGRTFSLDILDAVVDREELLSRERSAVLDHVLGATDVFVLCYSAASRASLDGLQRFWARVSEVCPDAAQRTIVCGCQRDVPDAERQVSDAAGAQFAASLGGTSVRHMQTSARDGSNVRELFVACAQIHVALTTGNKKEGVRHRLLHRRWLGKNGSCAIS